MDIRNKLNESQKILVGIGENISGKVMFDKIAELLNDKDYFVVYMGNDDSIYNSNLKNDKIAAPFIDGDDDKRWKDYLAWLSRTLNINLTVLELEVSFNHPEVIRFPFEKTVFYNNKAFFIRINTLFYQLPEELKDKGIGIKGSFDELFNTL